VTELLTGRLHVAALRESLAAIDERIDTVEAWGSRLSRVLLNGGRLLAAGNGGSAAEAQHLTAELVGRYRDDRLPLSAICLHGDTSSLTAIVNDYGIGEMFARQVRAHGRPGDVLVAFSTSGTSPNVLSAVDAARICGMTTWGLTGPAPNPLTNRCDDAIAVDAPSTATIQETHLVVVHLLCAAVDVALGVATRTEAVSANGRVRA
jgi:D-sedoheptulose 7-phosphate isomerase